MKSILRGLKQLQKAGLEALLAPAKDPRETFDPAYPRRQREPLEGLEDLALQGGFSDLGFTEGLKALEDLSYEYEQLRRVLGRRKGTDPLSVAHISALAEETYRQGLSVFEDALDLVQVIYSSDRERLEEEVAQLEKGIESLKEDATQAARVRIREETLASHRERLAMIQQQGSRVDELLHQSNRCEASLHRARMELAAFKTTGSETSISAVTETLRRTIAQAKEVQEELKKLGF